MALHDRPGHIDSLYPTISGRKLVIFPSQVKDDPLTEKSRMVYIQFETNYVEKLSRGSWPCAMKGQEEVNYFCLEQVVEQDANCYLPWGLGLGAGLNEIITKKLLVFLSVCIWLSAPHRRCRNANSLNTVLRHMPDERQMGKTDLNTHIKNLGCQVACDYIDYKPM